MKMRSGIKYSIVIAVLMICIMSMPAAAQLADTPWPMFHHDLNHTGLSTGYGPDTSFVNWTFSTGTRISGSAVIGEDGTVYVGTRNYQKPKIGSKLYAIYPNGTEKWHWTASHFIDSTPAVASDGTIYMGSWDKCLYALYPNGTKKWKFCTQCGGFVLSSPAIALDGTIYMGSNDKKLYAIYPNGTEKWNYCTGQSIQSSPAIGSDGIIYVGSCDKKLYAIYPNGTEKWNYCTGQSIQSSPAIDADGTIYVGSNDKKLYAIYPNGTPKWSYTIGDGIKSSAAIDADGTIYVGSNDSKLYAIYPNGTPKWSYTTGGEVESSPAIDADGTIYVGSKDGHVYAINPNGTLLWKYCTGAKILYSSPAIAADGTVYIGNWDGDLYAFGPGTPPLGTPNMPPVLDAIGNKTINETETVTIDLNASDQDGDTLTYSCNRTDLFSDFDSSTGAGNWTTDHGDSGTYWVNFGVSDGNGGTDNETIRIDVLDSNRPPVLDAIGDRTINETETVAIDLNATDPDGDSLTYSCNRTDMFTDFDSATGKGNWTTGYGDSGTYWVNFGVSDGNGGTDNETIRIDVLDSNRPPVLDAIGDRTINETETVTIDLNASDPDGDSLTYSCNRTDMFTDFDSATGKGNWTTDHGDSGTYWVNFGVSDGNGGIDNETIRITVLDSNRPPVLDPVGNKTINETETVTIDLNASDPDGDSLTYSCNRTNLFTDFDSSTGAGNWTTGYGDSGTYWVNFGVSDGNGGTDNETIRIDVLDSNRPPVLDAIGDRTINETETVAIDLDATDPDGDSLTYSCNRTNLFTDFDSSTGAGNWTTGYGDSGTYWVNFGVSDGNGGTDNKTIRIDVLDSNRPPVLDPVGDKTVYENSLLEFTVSAIDLDGDTLTYSASNLPTGAAFDPDTQTFSWTPGFDQEGTYPDVHFGVSDGESTDSENITITVNNVPLRATIEVVAPPECIGLGKQFDVLINITPMMGVPLMGAQFDLLYNKDAINVLTVRLGDFMDPPVNIDHTSIDNIAGVASFAASRTGTEGMTDPGTFAIVHCMAVGQGATSQLNLTNALAYDNSTPIMQEVTVETYNGSVEVCANAPPVPVARFNFTYNNMGDKILSKAYFNGTGSYDDGSITMYGWWFGDGQTGVGPTPEHVFNVRMYWEGVGAGGHYVPANVTLIITDDGMPLMDNMTHIDVTVWIGGDANGDGRVNIGDAVMVGYYWGSDCHTNADGLRWYDNLPADMADLNNDGRVNIGDTIPVGYCWGHTAW